MVWATWCVWKKLNLDLFWWQTSCLHQFYSTLCYHICLVIGSVYICDSQILFHLIALVSFNPSSEWNFKLPPNLFFFFSLLKTVLLQPSLSVYSVISLVWLFRSEIVELWSIAHFIFHRHYNYKKAPVYIFKRSTWVKFPYILHSQVVLTCEIFSILKGEKIIMVLISIF